MTLTAEQKRLVRLLSERPRSAAMLSVRLRRHLLILEKLGVVWYDWKTHAWRVAEHFKE